MKLLLVFLLSFPAFAAPVDEAGYNSLIDRAQALFAPYLQLLGHGFVMHKAWGSEETACYTSYERPPLFQTTLNGGAFRNDVMNQDSLAFTACHEISHVIGGNPHYMNDEFWGSAEGQADYAAANLCLKRLWEDDDNLSAIQGLAIPAAIAQRCATAFPDPQEAALCQRTVMAGAAFAENYRRYKIRTFTGARSGARWSAVAAPLSLLKPSSEVARKLNRSYPTPQCRLDTVIAGALCTKGQAFRLDSLNEPDRLNCVRPRCWFKRWR